MRGGRLDFKKGLADALFLCEKLHSVVYSIGLPAGRRYPIHTLPDCPCVPAENG